MNAKIYGINSTAPGAPLFGRSRVTDMSLIIDQHDFIEDSVPELKGRLDKTKIAVAGNSLGGQSTSMLLGARLTDPKDKNATDVNLMDTGFIASVLLAAPGNGGNDLSEFAAENYS